MSYQIMDGTGFSYGLKVDSKNKAAVNTVQQTQEAFYVREGYAFNINTGTITLTSGSKSALLYLLNNEDEDIIIPSFIYLLGNSTGVAAGEDVLVQIERNPTGGTLTSGTAVTPINRHFGSANTLNATVTKGAEASTLTGGTVAIESIFSGVGRKVVAVETVVPKGGSIGITVTPFATNSSMDVQLAMATYLNKFNF